MLNLRYDREAAVNYAVKWAKFRNPAYYDFTHLGGDCTNFVSQCLYSGSGVMNYTPTYGWYYNSLSSRAPAWTDVRYLNRFLVNNKTNGPYAETVARNKVEIGDIVQLGNSTGHFYHSSVIVKHDAEIYVAAHDDDSLFRPLSTYHYAMVRFLHILGVRKYQ